MTRQTANDVERVRACIDCGEPDPGLPDGRCRDCYHEHIVAECACRECYEWASFTAFGGPPFAHAVGCSLAGTTDYAARTPEELRAVREAMFGRAP